MLRPRTVIFPVPIHHALDGEADDDNDHGNAMDDSLIQRGMVDVTILESSHLNRAMAQSYCGHLWPSSLAMGLALCRWYAELVSGKIILELGAGTALPSILAGCMPFAATFDTSTRAVPGPQQIIATDMTLSSMPPLDQILAYNPKCAKSGLSMYAMPWGVAEAVYGVLDEAGVDAVDVVLAADCLFHHDVYDRVLATFSLIASVSPPVGQGGGAGRRRIPPVLVVAYQRRSSSHSIVPLLKQWDLKVTRVVKATQLADYFVDRELQDPTDNNSGDGSDRDHYGGSGWSQVYEEDPSWNMSGLDSVDVLFIEQDKRIAA